MSFSARRAVAVLALALTAGPTQAAMLTTGNILVSDAVFGGTGRIREFTPTGALVQTFNFPANDQPRDIVVDANGNIAIYNGTFSPQLTTLNPVTGAVVGNTTLAGWSTINNITYGGIAAFGNFVFVTDMATAGAGAPNGIIRFDITSGVGTRFGSSVANGPGDTIDLTIGRDGLLYAQAPGTTPGGNVVSVYDPTTLAFIRQVNLGIDLRSIAVAANGDIYAVAFNSANITRFSAAGAVLQTVTAPVGGFSDINLDASGRIVAAAGDRLLVTDLTLGSFTTLNVGTISPVGIFAAFVEPPPGGVAVAAVPEPASIALLGSAAVGLAGYRRLHRRPAA